MEVQWTAKALSDLVRLHEFLAAVNASAAARIVQALAVAPERLVKHPRLGDRIEGFGGRDIRRILVGDYEMRYEIQKSTVFILRLWHMPEAR